MCFVRDPQFFAVGNRQLTMYLGGISACIVDQTADIAPTELLQVAAAAVQTDEEADDTVLVLRLSLIYLLHQFLVHTVDVKRSNLIDKLVAKDVLSRPEGKQIKETKSYDVKVNGLLFLLLLLILLLLLLIIIIIIITTTTTTTTTLMQ